MERGNEVILKLIAVYGPSYQVFMLLQVWQPTCTEVLIGNVNEMHSLTLRPLLSVCHL